MIATSYTGTQESTGSEYINSYKYRTDSSHTYDVRVTSEPNKYTVTIINIAHDKKSIKKMKPYRDRNVRRYSRKSKW